MTDFEKPVYFRARVASFGAQRFLRSTAINVALLLGLIAFGLVVLYPLAQSSASRSATEGYEPMLLIGP